MILKIAICDDDNTEASMLHSILDTCQMMCDIDFQITHFQNGKELIDAYSAPGTFHILFLDVEMPKLDGIKTAELIRKLQDRRVIIIFVSNYPEYMQDSFFVHPYHYLQKPVSQEKIIDLMQQIITDIEDEKILRTLIQTDQSEETINLKDVLYIETIDAKHEILSFHFDNRSICTKGTLRKWEKELADYNFFLCYRSFLVNLIHIHFFDNRELVLDNGERIPISRKNEKILRDLYLNRVVILKNY